MSTSETTDQPELSSRLAAFGPNEWLVDEIYQQYLTDKSSVDPAWWDFFADYVPTEHAGAELVAASAAARAARSCWMRARAASAGEERSGAISGAGSVPSIGAGTISGAGGASGAGSASGAGDVLSTGTGTTSGGISSSCAKAGPGTEARMKAAANSQVRQRVDLETRVGIMVWSVRVVPPPPPARGWQIPACSPWRRFPGDRRNRS